MLHIRYEDLVREPENTLSRISEYLDIEFEPGAINYQKSAVSDGLGDPLGVNQHQRPVLDSLGKWAPELAAAPDKFAVVADQVNKVSDHDLQTFGYPRGNLWDLMESADTAGHKGRNKQWSRYVLTRRLLVYLRRDVNQKPLGKLVRKIRDYCDILLRG